jgi:hypothetical protein
MKTVILSAVGLAVAASSAHATLFSFASDNDHTSYTFGGFGQFVSNASDPSDRFTLLVDDDNGPLPALTFDVSFRFDGLLNHIASVPLGGGTFLHTYSLSGVQGGPASFGFFDALGNPVLTAVFAGGLFTAEGGQASWGSTAGIQGGDITGQVTYTWFGPTNAAYGLFSGASSIGIDDAAFTLTFLNSGGNPGVGLGPTAPYPGSEWQSEGSYSGSARFIPAPGVLTLAGLGAGLLIRRKR